MLTDKHLKLQKQKQPGRKMQWLLLTTVRTENIINLIFLKDLPNVLVCCTIGKVPLRNTAGKAVQGRIWLHYPLEVMKIEKLE